MLKIIQLWVFYRYGYKISKPFLENYHLRYSIIDNKCFNFSIQKTLENKYDRYKSINKQIENYKNNPQLLIKLYQNHRNHMNSINHCSIIRAIIKNIKTRPQLKKQLENIIFECFNQLKFRINQANSITFCNFLNLVMALEKEQFFIEEEFKKNLFNHILKRSSLLTVKQNAICLRSLKNICPQKVYKEQWINFINNVSFQIDEKYQNSQVDSLIYFYDSITLEYEQFIQKQTENENSNSNKNNSINLQKKLFLDSLKKKIAHIILDILLHVQLHEQSIKSLPIFIKAHSLNNQPSVFQTQAKQIVQKILEKNKYLNTIINIVALMETIKCAEIKITERAIYQLNKGILEKGKIIQQKTMIKPQQVKNLNKQSKNEYIIEGLIPGQINIIMNWFNYYKCWNPEVFQLIQNTFFALLIQHKINSKNISIYAFERSKMAHFLIDLILNQSHSQKEEISQNQSNKNVKHTSVRIQTIKKSHLQFTEKLIDYLNKYSKNYKTNTIIDIIKSAQNFPLSSRKLKSNIRKLLETKGIQDTSQGAELIFRFQ